jgi:hypothetical protein
LDLTNVKIQEYINDNISTNIAQLALKKSFSTVEWIHILNQIEAKAKAKTSSLLGLKPQTLSILQNFSRTNFI